MQRSKFNKSSLMVLQMDGMEPIHRTSLDHVDLKQGNVKVTHTNLVKVVLQAVDQKPRGNDQFTKTFLIVANKSKIIR